MVALLAGDSAAKSTAVTTMLALEVVPKPDTFRVSVPAVAGVY